MDAFFPQRAGSASATELSSAFGILYAEDFDEPEKFTGSTVSSSVSPVAPPPALTQADLDAACDAAVRAARREWQASREQATVDAFAGLSASLDSLRDVAERTAQAAAEGTVKTILAVVCGLLPQFSAEHGPAEVRALLKRVLPTLHSQARVSVRVHPELVATIQRDLDRLHDGSAAMIDIVAAPLEAGDVKVSWESGSLSRDTRQIIQAIEDALAELGLRQAAKAPVERRMAYAD